MTTFESSTVETSTITAPTTPATIEVIDCGNATKQTQGLPLLLLFEISVPPLDHLFL